MKKTTIQLFIILFFFYGKTVAQQVFLEKVNIEFARTVTVWPLLKEMDPSWYEQVKSNYPQESVNYYSFVSDGKKSLYKQSKEAQITRNSILSYFPNENVIYNDYSNSTTVSQKISYGENFLLQDSLLNIRWQITPDTRVIAGFECRKAVGIIYDSIAVFAFYTDEIKVSGGPEGINGLPGMILGVGVPKLHMTWFATKVNIATDTDLRSVSPATKGSKTNRSKMVSDINAATQGWTWGRKVFMALLL